MYAKVLILLWVCLKITNGETDSDEAKYIDLLPEQEKQDFLNRITKRIVAEIRSGSRPDKTSVEISDEKLNEHAAYVQKIMEEESDALRNSRRLESEIKEKNFEEDNDGLIGKSTEKHDFDEQEKSEVLDLTLRKNNRRKKDTNEESKHMSNENTAKIDESASEVPVSVLYDDESYANKIATDKIDEGDDATKEPLDENHLKVVGLNPENFRRESQISGDDANIGNNNDTLDIRNEDKEMEFKEIEEDTNINHSQKTYPAISVEQTNYTTPISQVASNSSKSEKEDLLNNEMIQSYEKKSAENASNEILSDTNIQLPKEESSTSNILNVSSVVTERETFKTDNDSLVENITTRSRLLETDDSDIQNNTEASLLINEDSENFDTQTIRPISADNNKSAQNVTTEKLQPATTPVDFRIELDSHYANRDSVESLTTSKPFKEIDNNTTKIKTQNVSVDKMKKNLRIGADVEEIPQSPNDRSGLHEQRSNLLSSDGENNNHYQVFEISDKKPPFNPTKKLNFGPVEEPHYVPVYNYAPENAFYSPYNNFGPNFDENGKLIKIQLPYYYNDEADDLNNKRGINTNGYRSKNKNVRSSQRNFKPYTTNNGYHRPRSTGYQNSLVPVWKQKVSEIIFNPYDYLDMDYYLGRANDASEELYNDVNEESERSSSSDVMFQDNSEDVIDPDPSEEKYNIKDKIRDLRNKLYNQKSDQAPEISTYSNNRQRLKTKLGNTEKNPEPILRGRDETLVIVLPGGGSNHLKKHDVSDKNIAVDYYFSRMNSGEKPLVKFNKTKVFIKRVTDTEGKSEVDKSSKNEKEEVVQEKRLVIPIKHENVLKIDIGVKRGNKVDIVFKNVKKPKQIKYDDYLNAYLNVLKDMIEYDNKGLVLYDWLGSTVDIQSAIKKLLELLNSLQVREEIHYSDFELLKYNLNMYHTSKSFLADISESSEKNAKIVEKITDRYIKKKSNVPKNMVNKSETPLDTLNEMIEYIKEMQKFSTNVNNDVLLEFENFLLDLQSNLYELHEAIKQIATVTKFKHQRWFSDLKTLYITPVTRDVSLKVLLHLASSKLFGLIEDSAKNGLEDNFIIFTNKHRAEVESTRDEFVFVLRLFNELNGLKN